MKEIKRGIYYVVNTINNKKIVGSSNNIEKRWRRYKSELARNRYGNPYLQRSYNKYGKECFAYYIIELCEESELIILEDYYIKELNTLNRNWGYNLKLASRFGPLTDKWKKNIGEAQKGKIVIHSAETKEKISRAMRGKKRGPMTDEQKKKLSDLNRGKIMSEESKRKMSKAASGRKHEPMSEETKLKISVWRTGRKMAEETKLAVKIGKANRTEEQKQETARKIGDAHRGKKISLEHVGALRMGLKNMTEESKKEMIRKRIESRKRNQEISNQKD